VTGFVVTPCRLAQYHADPSRRDDTRWRTAATSHAAPSASSC